MFNGNGAVTQGFVIGFWLLSPLPRKRLFFEQCGINIPNRHENPLDITPVENLLATLKTRLRNVVPILTRIPMGSEFILKSDLQSRQGGKGLR